MTSLHNRRRKRILRGTFQIRLLWTFLGMATLALCSQSLLLGLLLLRLTDE